VCETLKEATDAIGSMLDARVFGEAGSTVVIEEKMTGEEASVFVLADGKSYKILPVSQDHKRIGDQDTGPNTGGMGAYAPCPLVDKKLLAQIEEEIIVPTLDGMKKDGFPYHGLLYVGVMVTESGPRVVEYNCRFGDPETQAVLPLVDCDWYELFLACATGRLSSVKWHVRPEYCVSVVLASKGYPGKYEKGKLIGRHREGRRAQEQRRRLPCGDRAQQRRPDRHQWRARAHGERVGRLHFRCDYRGLRSGRRHSF